jgi:hypothetical protein
MAELRATLSWTLTLTSEEFVLVNRALRFALREDDVTPAHALCDKLTALRSCVIKSHMRTAEQLDRALAAKEAKP